MLELWQSFRSCRLPALVTVAVFVFVACQATPTAPPLLDLPATTASVAPDLEHWWTTFDDPTLTALIDEALAHNLDLQAAMVRVDLARSNVLLAQSYLYPSVNLGADASRNRMTLVGSQPLPERFNPTNNDYLAGLRASYELDLWGRYRQGASAARSELLATEYARQTVRTAVAAETARSYFGLLAADAELALLRETLKSRDETVALQFDLYQAGVIGDYDLQRAQAERAAVAANLAVAERAVGTYESALAAILGRSPRAVFDAKIDRDVTQLRLLGVPEVMSGLPSDLLERRPDILQAGTAEQPYYTNSSQLPVGFTDDPFEALERQEALQAKYTGGTVLHLYMGERLSSGEACKRLVRRALENFRLPYLTVTPTFSICPKHGYLSGEHKFCPKCDAELIEKKRQRLVA